MAESDTAPRRRGKGAARRNRPAAVAGGLAALALAGCQQQVAAGKDCPAAQRARSVSGFCVPRYVSLKRGEVYGRKGPGKDYPAQWIYHVKGLPVQIVAETQDWRRVCDPDGGVTWVHRSMVDGRRTVMAMGATPVALRKAPRTAAPAAGLLNARALAALEGCRGSWCKVAVGGVSGWVDAGAVWGLAGQAQCR
ncbi:MAG: SH3 domain-containing protein [Caulobacteraceae bacterium]